MVHELILRVEALSADWTARHDDKRAVFSASLGEIVPGVAFQLGLNCGDERQNAHGRAIVALRFSFAYLSRGVVRMPLHKLYVEAWFVRIAIRDKASRSIRFSPRSKGSDRQTYIATQTALAAPHLIECGVLRPPRVFPGGCQKSKIAVP